MSVTDERGPKKFLRLRRRWNGPGHESSQWPAPLAPVTDPREMLESNVAQDWRAGRFNVKPGGKRRSRRGWDFLLLSLAGNGAGAGFLLWAEAGPMTVLIVAVGMIFYTAAIGWVLFVHHDPY